MKIPTYIPNKVVDDEGYPTSDHQNYNDILNQQMQKNISDDGFVIPSQSTSTIQDLSSPTNPNAKGNGTFWYDETQNKYIGNENGTLVIFTTTPL